jgi:tetratricopeptide (TPR) repeat protein
MEEKLELFEDCWEVPTESTISWEIFEQTKDESGVVDGVNILGRAVGPFFVVDGKSQNNRFYEKKLWKKVLGESVDNMAKGRMLGTIGHGQSLDDAALLEGKASHRVSKLWIDESKKMGMGEVLILNTPAGRNLNAMIRGGVQLPVSSRGYGKYNGKMEDGTQIVDADSYKLETFDFVRVPGIANAIPTIVEHKEEETLEVDPREENSNLKENGTVVTPLATEEPVVEETTLDKEKDIKMDEKVLQKMTEEKISLEQQLAEALKANETLQDANEALKGQVSELNTTISEYRTLGTTEEISKVMDVTESMLENRPVEEADVQAIREQLAVYEELGTPDELEELFDKFETFIDGYEELGSPDEVNEALDRSMELLEAYHELGTPVDVAQAFDATEGFMAEMKELGTIEELKGILDVLEAYQEYGTPQELGQAFEMMNTVVDTTRAKHVAAETAILAKEYGVAESVAGQMVESMGSARAKEILGAINEQRSIVNDRYKAGNENLNEDVKVIPKNEDTEKKFTPGTRVNRLFETMSR